MSRLARLLHWITPPRALLCAALGLLGWIAFAFLRRDPFVIIQNTSDDMFYYLKTAKNIAFRHGATFDGMNPTNGFHPAWTLLLIPISGLFRSPPGYLRAALTICVLFHAAASVFLYRVMARLTRSWYAALVACFYMLNPVVLHIVFQGVESSLNVLLLSASVEVLFFRLLPVLPDIDEGVEGRRLLLLSGGLLAALFLSRTDEAIFVVWTCVLLAIPFLAHRRWKPLLRGIGIAGAPLLVSVLGWVVFCLATVGRISQDSGRMKLLWGSTEHAKYHFDDWWKLIKEFLGRDFFARPVDLLFGAALDKSDITLTPEMQCMLVALLVGVAAVAHTQTRVRDLIRLTAWLLPISMAQGMFYALAFAKHDRQPWYLAQPLYILVLLLGAWAWEFGWRAVQTGWVKALVAVVAVSGILHNLPRYGEPEPSFGQKVPPSAEWATDMAKSQLDIEKRLGSATRVGCFNCGVEAFFSRSRMINLDGLINHRAAEAWQTKTLDEYIRSQHIEYIADEYFSLRRSEDYMKVTPLIEETLSWPMHGAGRMSRKLWRIRWPTVDRR